MAGNNLLTSSVIVKRGLAKLMDDPQVLGMVNRQYDTQFGYKGGARYGDTVSVRVPQHAVIRKGRIMDLQPIVNKTIPVKIDQYYGVDTGATSAEMAMQIEDFADEFIDPFIPDLLANVEADFLNKVTPLVPATVGDYGAFDDAKTALQAKAYLDSQLAPKGNRNLLINTYSQVDIVDSLKGLYNSQGKLDRQYRKGDMASDTLGFDWYSSNLTAYTTRGTAAGYLVNGVAQSGSSLVVDTGTGTLNLGDTFTIAGVFDLHAQTKQNLPGLKQFTVTAPVTPGGAGTWAISPEIVATGSEKNVSNAPADNAVITVKGTAGTSYAQNLAFSKDAFYFVTADLPNPPDSMGVDSASATYKGITLRFQRGFDIVNDMWLSRFDLCWGGGILQPELAVRIPATVTGI
ncbi:MAG: hypothetical protein H0V66_00245 [Bdellovibrionales bacterium]|nr:hypothetical protein [Bdellovibrionales bacterium]